MKFFLPFINLDPKLEEVLHPQLCYAVEVVSQLAHLVLFETMIKIRGH